MTDKEKAALTFFKVAGLGIKLANTINELVGGKPKPMLGTHYLIMTGYNEAISDNPNFELLYSLIEQLESANKIPLQNETPNQVSDQSNQ